MAVVPPATLPLKVLLGDTLLAKGSNGGLVTVDTDALKNKTIALYFSAHWCPPCRAFTPVLRKFYLECVAAGRPFEIVFISSDHSKAEMEEYHASMPWLAVPYEKGSLRESLSRRFKVLGIPTLTILDANGQVLNSNARSALINDPQGQKFPWVGQQDGIGGSWTPIAILLLLGLFYFFFIRGGKL